MLLQHFPLYRSSEVNCTGRDSPPLERRNMQNREGWEVLSQTASELLMSSLQPRAIFGGHTHYSCQVLHQGNIPEFTLPSFSWRNRNDPSFMMVSGYRYFSFRRNVKLFPGLTTFKKHG